MLLALLPPALVLLFAGWSGGLFAPLDARWVVAGHAALVAFALLGAREWRDPLRLGRGGAAIYVALGIAVGASWLASPVPRAGWLGLLLLPAFLLVPAATARCWSTPARRRLGVDAMVAVTAAVAAWSLLAWWRIGGERPALPLGHHNLLAGWLAAALPLAAIALGRGGVRGLIARPFVALAGVALLATRSLAAIGALAVVAAIAAIRALRPRPRMQKISVLVAGIGLLSLAPRIADVVAGRDPSAAARIAYLEAAWDGIAERPLLGWGPGATAWTIAPRVPPRPGVLPAGLALADPHSLPLQLAYELGAVGLALVILLAVVFVRRRRLRAGGDDPGLRRAALFGLLAWGIAALGGMPLQMPALPLLAAVLAGAALATSALAGETHPPAAKGARAAAAVVVVCALLALPLERAHLAYDRARAAAATDRAGDVEGAALALAEAARLDPRHPLYRFRLAVLETGPASVEAAIEVSHEARIAALSLGVGELARRQGWRDDARERLRAACGEDPLGAAAPFLLTLTLLEAATPSREATDLAARALLAEPRLLAARAWRRRPTLRRAAVERVTSLAGVDDGWRLAFAAAAEATDPAETAAATDGATQILAVTLDADPATSPSLLLLRRAPWPADLVEIELDSDAVTTALDPDTLPPATTLAGTDPAIFARGCGLGPP